MTTRTAAAGLVGLALAALFLAAPWSQHPRTSTPQVVATQPEQATGAGPEASRAAAPMAPPAPAVVYDWPLYPQPEVIRGFEAPAQRWGRGHRGVDLATPHGTGVRAAAEGVVVFAGRVVDRPVVSLDHPDGVRTTYEPVDPAVRPGQRVGAGTLIGDLASTDTGAHCDEHCLHWGARTGPDAYLDPLLLLRSEPVPVRLYPVEY